MIHFFKITELSPGKRCFATLPGQKLGKKAVSPDILVKAEKNVVHRFQTTRSAGAIGDVFYTSSLKERMGCYSAADIAPVGSLTLNAKLDWDLWNVKNNDISALYSGDELREKILALFESSFIRGTADLEFYLKMGLVSESLFSKNGETFVEDSILLSDNGTITVFGTGKDLREKTTTDQMSDTELVSLYRNLVIVADNARNIGFAVGQFDWKLAGNKIYILVPVSQTKKISEIRNFKSHCIQENGLLWVESLWLFKNAG